MRIPVYILETQKHGNSLNIKKLFERSCIFKVVKLPCKRNLGSTEVIIETNQVMNALENSHKHFRKNYTIIIKDTSVTNSDTGTIEEIVSTAIDININNKHCKKHDWHLCYLSKWLDRCDLYTEEAKIDHVTKVVKTLSPFGVQSILFSPQGRDIVIGKKPMNNGKFFTPIVLPLGNQLNINIGLENINATAIIPNLFDFNIMLATDNLDLLKLSECREPSEIREPPGAIPFMWFIAISVIVILLAWFFYQFIGKYTDISGTQDVKVVKKKGG